MYFIDTYYTSNVFGADEHYVVRLRRKRKNGKFETINKWPYSTFLSSSFAHARAERRITKLRMAYNAEVV